MTLRYAPIGSLLKEPREKRRRDKTPVEKRPGNDPDYLAKVRQLPCCVCMKAGLSEAHHLKSAGDRGAGKRAADRWALPLCREHHINGVERVGSRNEIGWFKGHNIDCLTLASALYANKHDTGAMMKVLQSHGGEG